jgi:hypothetical protein
MRLERANASSCSRVIVARDPDAPTAAPNKVKFRNKSYKLK